ncbi:MAG: hypothetical protein KGI97_08545, partial [Alphaproteobacteria bacterium]|nr:hypothetical protein [Alphaproteobacteria bacterium]
SRSAWNIPFTPDDSAWLALNLKSASRFVTAGYFSLLQQSKPRLDCVFCIFSRARTHHRFRKGTRVLCFFYLCVKDIFDCEALKIWPERDPLPGGEIPCSTKGKSSL